MKNIYYSIVALILIFSSCNEIDPLEDINNEIDNNENIIVGDDIITLTEDDYEALLNEDEDENFDTYYFTDNDTAKELIAGYLSELYPVWGEGSLVTVSYELESGTDLEEIENYTSATVYTLETSDYPGGVDNASGFYEFETPSETIATPTLTNNFPDAEEGDIVFVKYNQYVGETEIGYTEFYLSDFQSEQTLLEFETVDVFGDQEWEATQYGAAMSGYSGGANENEDWLISEEIDLTDNDNALFQVNQVLNYGSYEEVSVLISKDYSGDITTATWDEIELTNVPEGNSWTEYLSDDYSLSAYNGETIRIAFKYNSTDSSAPNWQIAQVYLKGVGVSGETEFNEVYYSFDGSEWSEDENSYYLTSDDYDAMGESSGQPGRYNNFSSSALPNNYIPAFLAQKYPFAQEEDALYVIFKYYNGSSTVLRGNEFVFTNGVWEYDITQTQFKYEVTEWVPDNTIKYTFTSSDYSTVASSSELAANYEGQVSNLDQYGNFFRYESGVNYWTDEMMAEAIGVLLDTIDPSAEEGQKYIVTVSTYGPSDTEDFSLIKESGEWILNE